MVKRWNRLLVAFFVITDSMLGMIGFVLAYVLRFETGLIEAPKGYPPFAQYINVLPLIGALVPLAYQVQGIYRLRRGRTRVDDFFADFVGSILAVVLGVVTTLYIQTYYVPDELKDRGAFEVSQLVWAGSHGVVSLHIAKCKDAWVDWRDPIELAHAQIEVMILGLVRDAGRDPGFKGRDPGFKES